MSLSDVEPLDRPHYEEVSSITRSLHLRPAMASYGKQRLASHKIVSKTVDLGNVKVLWFAPTRPMNENNMYGNVSFTLDWETALKQLGPYLYYVDQQENGEFIYSRVLLTNKEYEFLTPVDEDGHRMPMMKFANKHYAATVSDGVKHVLEVGVEVDCNREKWLYLNCKIQANNHSSANTLQPCGSYKSCTCHRFNYFKNECPSPYKLQRTKKILEKRCPTMLRDGPAGTSPSTHIIPKTNKPVEVVNDEDYDDDGEEDYEVYDFVSGYDDHKVVEYTATARRIVTTKVEVVERAPAVKPKNITPVTTPSSTTNVKTSGFTSASVISSNVTSHRTYGSPSASVGHFSGAISSSTAAYSTYKSPPSSSVGHFSSSSPGYTSYRSDLYRTPSASVFASGTPQKDRDEGLSTGEKVLVGALVAGGVALFAGLASLFGGDDKKKSLKKGNSWWS